MSEHTHQSATTRLLALPMRPRSPAEAHRASTPLELLFDLVFVVAVAQAAAGLHHTVAEGHAGLGVLRFAMVFFGIWWAWMNFTWFASAYDTDDVLYRITTFVQLLGALILAAGVPSAFNNTNFTIIVTGYVVMRLALVAQWLRAARSDPQHRSTALRYATGVTVMQALWILRLMVPDAWQVVSFVLLALAELAVPIWAERAGTTTWHPGHIAERYGLFTIIVLGESILSTTLGIQSAAQEGGFGGELLEISAGALLLVLSMWWLYFDRNADDMLTSLRVAFVWGYGHLFLFAAAAAVGAGLAVEIDYATHQAEISGLAAGAAVAVPVALYLLALLLMHLRPSERGRQVLPALLSAALIVLTPWTGHAVLLSGLLLVALLCVKIALRSRAAALQPTEESLL